MHQYGMIELIMGPMFSGKSSELLRKIRRFQHAKKKCLVVNYLHDNRYSLADEMATHDKVTKKAVKALTLTQLSQLAMQYQVIGIDQGQFFPDIVQFSQQMANLGKMVIVAALDATFQRKPFGNIIGLIPLAQKLTKLSAVCVYCSKEASFTKRIIQCMEIQLIGGDEMYKPVCRGCFHKEHKNSVEKIQEVQIKEVEEKVAQQILAKVSI